MFFIAFNKNPLNDILKQCKRNIIFSEVDKKSMTIFFLNIYLVKKIVYLTILKNAKERKKRKRIFLPSNKTIFSGN